MDQTDELIPMEVVDPEMRQVLGLFDVPAYVRRGQDVESALARLHSRVRRERDTMLTMTRLRLRQWAAAVEGPDASRSVLAAPVVHLWALTGADDPVWATKSASDRHRRAVARDLVASIERFNRRWTRYLSELKLESLNDLIDKYNRYYLVEKECSLGSSRLAARYFIPRSHVTADGLLSEYGPLPVPVLAFEHRKPQHRDAAS
jgi:hypothetical protein